MTNISIGILKEGKIPIDKRVPFVPEQIKYLVNEHPELNIAVQRSDIRCYSDEEYATQDVSIVDDMTACDVLFGVKEVPIDQLIPNKTYFFFSHTIKKQAYNRELLVEILAKNIKLVDYECLTDDEGRRLVAFGRYAGLVGAYNAIYTYGKRYNLYHLRRAHECFDLDDLKEELKKSKLPPIRVVITGGGRVAKGAMEILFALGMRKVSAADFLERTFDEPVFSQLNARDYNRHKNGADFSREEFYAKPELYESDFLKYGRVADMLIAAAFWDPRAPVLFTRQDVLAADFNIKIVADVTCDIEGSIPSTKKASTVEDPIYDYNPSDDKMEPAFSDEGNISVMAVDNLPCELPRNASADFGRDLIANVIPALLADSDGAIIDRASITSNGELTEAFSYLRDYVNGQ